MTARAIVGFADMGRVQPDYPDSILDVAVHLRRQELCLTQADVAERGGPSMATIIRIEQGSTNVHARTAIRLEKSLQWKAGSVRQALLGREPKPSDTLRKSVNSGGSKPPAQPLKPPSDFGMSDALAGWFSSRGSKESWGAMARAAGIPAGLVTSVDVSFNESGETVVSFALAERHTVTL